MPASGSAQLHAIAAKLKAAGAGRIKLQMTRDLRTGANPVRIAVHDAAVRQLPHEGGLNEQVAGQKVSIRVLTGARNAAVRLTTSAPDTAMTDSGFVRKPVFGNRQRWVTQEIPNATGWWTNTCAVKSLEVTPVLLAGMEKVAAEIQDV